MRTWIAVLESQIRELELIASWASAVDFGRVRDHCHGASHELKCEIDRLKTTFPEETRP